MPKPKFEILLYYKYINIDNPEKLVAEQITLCESLDLKGRIIISKEGINGTVEGGGEDTQKYISEMIKNPDFSDIHFKKSEGDGKAFPKLSIKLRDEIVSAHLGNNIDLTKITG